MSEETAPQSLKFKFVATHHSIDHLPVESLPSFSVITGLNGCGKTQFLQALQGGRISIDGIPQNDVQYYSWQSFGARDDSIGGRVSSQSQAQWASLQGRIQRASGAGVGQSAIGRNLQELIEQWRLDQDQRPQIESEIRRHYFATKQNLPPVIQELLSSFETETGIPWPCITEEQFCDRVPLVVAEMDPFQGSLAELFAAYISALEQNDLVEVRMRRGVKGSHLSEEQFRQKYGPPPWEIVNKVLVEANLDYRVETPSQDPERPVSVVLRKPSLQVPLSFGSLSSGEKILMSLALCMFFLRDGRQPTRIPAVMLFDEVDAFLHPEMSGSFISVVNKILVGEYKRHVVVVTHSPSTVALAPVGSVFIMDGASRNIRRATADEGISALTVGVPTLSIKLENRRQVFVESENDVRIWERCYRYAKPHLHPGVSLSFLASGAPRHAGCARVKGCVKDLRDAGNTTVSGIVDWDLSNEPDDGLFVIGYKKRYSIENYLLDPVLLGGLLIRDKIIKKEDSGLGKSETFVDMRSMDSTRLQAIADTVLERLGFVGGDKEPSAYAGGQVVQIPTSFLRTRGHDLEERVKEIFPSLNRFVQEPFLKLEVLDKVVDDLSILLPVDLVEIMKQIQAM